MTELYRVYGEGPAEIVRARNIIAGAYLEAVSRLMGQRPQDSALTGVEFAAMVMARLAHAEPPMLISTLDHVTDPVELALAGHYVSTYCQHAVRDDRPELHDECRLNCKIEEEPCRCPCHETSPTTPGAIESSSA